MNHTRTLLAGAIDAVQVHTPTRYSWFGRMSARLPPRITSALTPRTARDYLLHTLAAQLYADFYLRGQAEPAQWPIRSSAMTRGAFESALSLANQGHGYRDRGWSLRAVHGDEAVVAKGGLELRMSRSELVEAGELDDLEVGARVAVRMPKELLRIAPGFYTACGDAPLSLSQERPLLRLYWNLDVTGAAVFMAQATQRLNAAEIPFRLKVLNDPGTFSRCDAAVVYLHEVEPWESVALNIHEQVSQHLRARTPVFTRPLAPGLAMAYDPGTDESFGQHRCRLLADALLVAHELDVRDAKGIIDVTVERFAEDGLDLDAAYLNPVAGSASVGPQ